MVLQIDNYKVKIDKSSYPLIKDKTLHSSSLKGYIYFFYYTNQHKKIWLHKLFINCPDNKRADHKNLDTLDCRVKNLRICNQSQNRANSKIGSHNKLGIKGVKIDSCVKNGIRYSYYRAEVFKNKKRMFTKSFPLTPEGLHKAKQAYQNAAKKTFGEFARFE